jgi:membrane-associated protease RseP (regulator of RpoE activity)
MFSTQHLCLGSDVRIQSFMNDGGEFERFSIETFTPVESADVSPEIHWERRQKRWQRKSFVIAAVLFLLTLVSTLVVGASFAASYALGQSPDIDGFFSMYGTLLYHPQLLLAGVPFAFTLLAILLAHELGHYFACRYYGISASYPYFIPAPTLIGTLGAFIRIRSPIQNRKALFDVGLAGPVVGFLFAIPALAIAITYSKVIPLSQGHPSVLFGNPLALRILLALLRPGVPPSELLLHPVGRAAWVGLFATALNLLPGGQLDGGHILYAAASKYHKGVTLVLALLLIPLGYRFWAGWYLWAALLLGLGFRHPPLLYQGGPLDRTRLIWTAVAVLIFILTFMPMPVLVRGN